MNYTVQYPSAGAFLRCRHPILHKITKVVEQLLLHKLNDFVPVLVVSKFVTQAGRQRLQRLLVHRQGFLEISGGWIRGLQHRTQYRVH